MSAFISKLKNWWWYNKLYLLIGIAAVAVLIYCFVPSKTAENPDYYVAVVTELPLREEQYSAVSERLAALGEDVNGDGEVSVHVKAYGVDLENPSPIGANENFQLVAALDADLVGKVSGLFILDDPELFQQVTNNALDGSFVPFQDGLAAAVRHDADAEYFRLLEALSTTK